MRNFAGRLLRAATLALAAFGAVVAVQMLRLRRITLLPGHPGFWIGHIVPPSAGPADGPRLRLAMLGDSTTVGIGVDRAEVSLPYRIAQLVADARGRPVHVATWGWAGARVEDVANDQVLRATKPLRREPPDAAGYLSTAEIVVLVVGANDATHQTPPAAFRRSLRAVLAHIRGEAPRAEVVIVGIPRLRGALVHLEPLIAIADAFGAPLRRVQRQEAERFGAAFADLAREVVPRLRGRIDRADALASDQFHPGPQVYATWADVIVEALEARRLGTEASSAAPEPMPAAAARDCVHGG